MRRLEGKRHLHRGLPHLERALLESRFSHSEDLAEFASNEYLWATCSYYADDEG
jgi:hypothetical protein